MIPFKMQEVPRSESMHINDRNPYSDVIKVFKSDRFLVQLRQHGPIMRLAVNKTKWTKVDGKIRWADGITWDELQEIKDQCGFKDKWFCEYYPPQKNIINIANIRHLWIMDREPEYRLDKPITTTNIRSEVGTVGGFRWLKSDGTIGHLKDGETMEMPT